LEYELSLGSFVQKFAHHADSRQDGVFL
jgi:hypothetical protein